MLLASLRLGFLFATLVASLHVTAAPRFWTLTGVQFEDGAVATGYFSYDDATRTVANWNLRVSGGPGPFIPWTFVPGNSYAWLPESQPLYVYSLSPSLDPGFYRRSFVIRPLVPLDGSSTTVSIDVSASHDFFEDDFFNPGKSRKFVAGSLMLTPLPPPVTLVQVDEFYHLGLRHYFITADAAEKQLLDTGVHPGWERTGESFNAYATGSRPDGSISPVCRYYGNPLRGLDSHFYSASGQTANTLECESVFVTNPSEWLLESDNVFQINLPDTATGACPAGTIPVYRLWNQRVDSNHRYTTSLGIRAQMLAGGFLAEGYGPEGIAFCAPTATYYVDPVLGSDASPTGSAAAPYKTLQKGSNVALPGDTIIAKNGVYTAQQYPDRVLEIHNNGTEAAPITIRAENPLGAIIDGNNYTVDFGIVPLEAGNYYLIDGFEMRRFKTGAFWLIGTVANKVHNMIIRNNWVHDIARYESANCVDDAGGSGAYSNGDVYNVEWYGNVFQDIGRIPHLACDANMSATNNYRHDHGLYLGGKGHNVHHNVFISMYAGYAIKADGHYEAASGPTHIIRNNTFAFPTNPHEISGHVRFFSNDQGGGSAEQNAGRTMIRAHDVLVENNISYLPPDHSGDPGAASWGSTFVAALYDGFMYHLGTIANNNLTTAGSIVDEAYGGTQISSKVTFAGNVVNANAAAIFVNPGALDFHLAAGSPAIGAGVGGVDLGAFPYTVRLRPQ